MGVISSRAGEHEMAGQSPVLLQERRADPGIEASISHMCRSSGKLVHGNEAGPRPSWQINLQVRVRSSDCWTGLWQRLKTQD